MIKTVSYNINGIRAAQKLGVLDWFKDFNAEIYCLQEVRADKEICENILSGMAGYNVYYNCGDRKGYAGTAILSKGVPGKVEIGMGKGLDIEGRTIALFFDDLVVINSYIPNGNTRLAFKLEYMEELLAYAKQLQKEHSVVLCLDTNVAYNEKDCSKPKLSQHRSGFLPIERQKLAKFFDNGFVDAYREFNPDKPAYTWRSYKSRQVEFEVGTKFRFDYIMVNEKLKDKLKDCAIHNLEYSDHLPVVAEIDVKL